MPRLNEETGLKECTKCHEHKPAEMFYKNSKSFDKLTSHCIECELASKRKLTYDVSVEEKLCKDCNLVKNKTEFYTNKGNPTGLSYWCKECHLLKCKSYNNPPKEEGSKVCRICNINKDVTFFQKDKAKKDGLSSYCRDCKNEKLRVNNNTDESRLRRLNYVKHKETTDSFFKLRKRISGLIRARFRNVNLKKNNSTVNILGISILEFRLYIELLFDDVLNWDNMNTWHLDHIIPMNLAKTEDDLYVLSHYSNYRPLLGVDNIAKHDNILHDVIETHFENYPDSLAYKFYLDNIKGVINE